MFSSVEVMKIDTNLDVKRATHPIKTIVTLMFFTKIGMEMPRYAKQKFSHMYPRVSIRYSIVILPQGLKE